MKKAQLNISYPMLFKLINGAEKKHSHAGVLEFIAEEGRVYLPQWVSSH
jgi:ubiquitin fusion degradation protein 1